MSERVTIWFLSDPHFGHANIIKYCDRPFADTEEMDEALVAKHNAVVKPGDHFYCLGDVTMRRQLLHIVHRLNGHKRLLLGNHDIFSVQDYLNAGFEKVGAWRVLDNHVFTHVPIHPASLGKFVANVHGHIHNNGGDYGPRYLNVSAEVIDYTPITLEDVKLRVAKQQEAQ